MLDAVVPLTLPRPHSVFRDQDDMVHIVRIMVQGA